MKKLLLALFLISCLCHAQGNKVMYYSIKPVPQTIRAGDYNYVTRYSRNSLEIEEGHTENNNLSYKISMAGKVLKDWFCEDNVGSGGESFIYIYYSPEAKDYYVFIWTGFEIGDWVDVFYVTPEKAEYKGIYGYDWTKPDYYFNTGNPSHEFIEKRDFEEVYTQNGTLHIASFVGGDLNRVMVYKHQSATAYRAAKDAKQLAALEKLLTPPDGIITLELDLNSDDTVEKYGIDFKNKKISDLNDGAKKMRAFYADNPNHFFWFKQDTLIITKHSFWRLPDPTRSQYYKDHYYFVASPYDDNPQLVKRVNAMDVEVYEEPGGPYAFTYYTNRSIRLSDLPKYLSPGYSDYFNPEYRPFTLPEIEKHLKNNSDYYTWRELPPSAYELYRLLQREPLTVKNVTRYNDVAYYLEQLIQNHILKENNGKGTNQYYRALSAGQYILEKILEQFPNRTVAHLNMADLLWNNYDKEPSKKYYKSYIDLMKKDGKEPKIPARAYERIK